MPMIDVYAATGTFAKPHALAQALATELMTIEQVPDIPMFRRNTAAFVHEMASSSLSNVDGESTYARVQDNPSSLPCPPNTTTAADDQGSDAPGNQVTVYACFNWRPPMAGFVIIPSTIPIRAVVTESLQRQQ